MHNDEKINEYSEYYKDSCSGPVLAYAQDKEWNSRNQIFGQNEGCASPFQKECHDRVDLSGKVLFY